jgi:hypothetical protein
MAWSGPLLGLPLEVGPVLRQLVPLGPLLVCACQCVGLEKGYGEQRERTTGRHVQRPCSFSSGR